METNFRTKARGFTIVELLIVIVILVVLAIILLTGVLPSAIKRGRDTQRKSDLREYQVALENYATDNSQTFPVYQTETAVSTTLCPAKLASYIAKCVVDPGNGANSNFSYKYSSDNAGLKWVLWAKFEQGKTWVNCSNGKSGLYSGALPLDGGICPL